MDLSQLQQRFYALWPSTVSEEKRVSLWRDLSGRYAEPWRYYHTLEHIADLLAAFDRVRDLAEQPLLLELAIWYHDIIYTVGSSDNESRSAEHLLQQASGCLSDEQCQTVAAMILDTRHLNERPSSADGELLADVDLAGLSAEKSKFSRDSQRVREEFRHLDSAAFTLSQIGFLSQLLIRSSVYYTDFFRTHHEQAARANLNRYLHQLRQRISPS